MTHYNQVDSSLHMHPSRFGHFLGWWRANGPLNRRESSSKYLQNLIINIRLMTNANH